MLPANSAQPDPDEAIDAIVYDAYPPRATPGDYPYSSPPPEARSSFVVRPQDLHKPLPLISFTPPRPAEYMVPQRFGMSAILGIMTALAVLFGVFRLIDADPVVYLFFGIQSLVICVAQMFNARAPRFASVVAGMVMAPLFATQLFEATGFDLPRSGLRRLISTAFLVVIGVPIGAFLGYLTGTCAAGVFLVMDYVDRQLAREPASAFPLPSSITQTP